jgi:hypothetical protein
VESVNASRNTTVFFIIPQLFRKIGERLILKDIDAARIRNAVPGRGKVGRAQGVNREIGGQEKSGLTVATLISTPNPVSQVLW